MPNLKEVKTRINSVKSIQQITKAMKMVAAAKLRKAQDKVIQVRPYSNKLLEILSKASTEMDTEENVYAQKRTIGKILIVPITSDRGLCGSFNSNIFKAVKALRNDSFSFLSQSDITVMPIGTKSFSTYKKQPYELVTNYAELLHYLKFDEIKKAAEKAILGFLNGKYDKVILVYNKFKNVATQIVEIETLLPMQEKKPDSKKGFDSGFILEPDKEQIIRELIPKVLKTQFLKAVLESNASEHGARMTAMSKATDNAGELLKDLRLTYNRTRQAAITTELTEIVAGAESLNS